MAALTCFLGGPNPSITTTPLIVEALAELPGGTVVDGEVVALDESGRPNFNLLQNFRSEASHIHYFVVDLLICQDRDLTRLPLSERRKLMKSLLKFTPQRQRASGKALTLIHIRNRREIPRLRRRTFRRSGVQEKASTCSARNDGSVQLWSLGVSSR